MGFSIRYVTVLMFLQISFCEDHVLSSLIEEPQKKKWCALCRSTRLERGMTQVMGLFFKTSQEKNSLLVFSANGVWGEVQSSSRPMGWYRMAPGGPFGAFCSCGGARGSLARVISPCFFAAVAGGGVGATIFFRYESPMGTDSYYDSLPSQTSDFVECAFHGCSTLLGRMP